MARRRWKRGCFWALAATVLGAGSVAAQPPEFRGDGDAPGSTFIGSDREQRPLGTARPAATPLGGLVQPEAARRGPGGSVLDNTFLRTGGSLAIVLGLIFILARVARRLNAGGLAGVGSPSPAGIIEVLGRYPIGRGQSLILLRLDTRILLLAQATGGLRVRGGSSAGALNLLCEIDSAEDVASILMKVQSAGQAGETTRFADALNRFDSRLGESSGVIEVGRSVRSGRGGDRVELLDVGQAPGVLGSLRGRLAAMRASAFGGGTTG